MQNVSAKKTKTIWSGQFCNGSINKDIGNFQQTTVIDTFVMRPRKGALLHGKRCGFTERAWLNNILAPTNKWYNILQKRLYRRQIYLTA